MALLQPGETFGAYRLGELISRGGMGEVWRATKIGLGDWRKEVALKVILPTVSDQERFVDLFLSEARLAALLDHPNIVPVFASGREGDLLWMEQELIEGEDLNRILEGTGPLPIPLALFVTAEVLKGLQYAHERRDPEGRRLGVVHRDVKPHNVLVAREGHVKISDFGIAKATAQSSASLSEIKGTAGYIAPEILEGSAATARADLFGAGLILWECLTGRKLFEGETDAIRLKKTFECTIPPLASAGAQAPAAVERILRRLLARDPGGRFPSAGAALEAVLGAPHGREAGSLELKRFLAGKWAGRPAGGGAFGTPTGTMAGEVTAHGSGRVIDNLNRWFGSRLVLGTLGLVAAAAIAAVFLVKPSAPAPAERTAAAVAPSPEPPDVPAETPTVAEAPAEDPAPIPPEPVPARVTIAVTPADAAVHADGERLRGRSPHVLDRRVGDTLELRVERRGYARHDARLTLEEPAIALPIVLDRETSSRSRPAPAPAALPVRNPDREPPKTRPSMRDKDAVMLPPGDGP